MNFRYVMLSLLMIIAPIMQGGVLLAAAFDSENETADTPASTDVAPLKDHEKVMLNQATYAIDTLDYRPSGTDRWRENRSRLNELLIPGDTFIRGKGFTLDRIDKEIQKVVLWLQADYEVAYEEYGTKIRVFKKASDFLETVLQPAHACIENFNGNSPTMLSFPVEAMAASRLSGESPEYVVQSDRGGAGVAESKGAEIDDNVEHPARFMRSFRKPAACAPVPHIAMSMKRCSVCTLDNTGLARECVACGAPLNCASNVFLSCQVCTFENTHGSTACVVCGNPLTQELYNDRSGYCGDGSGGGSGGGGGYSEGYSRSSDSSGHGSSGSERPDFAVSGLGRSEALRASQALTPDKDKMLSPRTKHKVLTHLRKIVDKIQEMSRVVGGCASTELKSCEGLDVLTPRRIEATLNAIEFCLNAPEAAVDPSADHRMREFLATARSMIEQWAADDSA